MILEKRFHTIPNDSIAWSSSKWYTIEFCEHMIIDHQEGEVEGVSEEEEEGPLMLWVSLPEVPKEVASLRETEEPSAGSFFIGVRGGVSEGGEWEQSAPPLRSSSSSWSSPEEPREGEVFGVSNGVFTLLALTSDSFS